MRLEEMDNPETILNLWFVYDDLGMIYSLRARAYIGTGTDEEKLSFLKQFADVDYLIAQSFPIPEHLRTTVVGESTRRLTVASGQALGVIGGPPILFEEVYKQIESGVRGATEDKTGLRNPRHPETIATMSLTESNVS